MITLAELTKLAVETSDFRTEKQAIKAVEFMEQNGLTEAIAVGLYGLQEIPKGTRVCLKAGAKFRSTHPKYRGNGPHINGRARYFTVFDTYKGYIDYHNAGRAEISNPEIVWVGSDGYWFYADINDVEIAV
jgi:hypothetical protein